MLQSYSSRGGLITLYRGYHVGGRNNGIKKMISDYWKEGEKERHKEFQTWAEFENRGFRKPEYMDCWFIEKYGIPKDVLKKDVINVRYEKFQSYDARHARVRQAVRNPNEILIKVHAASLNPIDVKMCQGYGKSILNFRRNVYYDPLSKFVKMNDYTEFPIVLGRDFSGTVVDVGTAVFDIVPGDEVYGAQELYRNGSLSDYICTHLKTLCQKPATLSHIEAAALPYVATTTLSALGDFANNAKGKRALLLGGAGGIGTFAIQYLKAKGAYVAVTCSEAGRALCNTLGADECYDYTISDHKQLIMQEPRFDFVFDIVGAESPSWATDVLHSGGTYASLVSQVIENTDKMGVVLGLSASASIYFKSALPYGKIKVTWPYFSPNRQALLEVAKLVDEGLIKPVVQKVFNFQDVPQAFDMVATAKAKGKVAINVSGLAEASQKPDIDRPFIEHSSSKIGHCFKSDLAPMVLKIFHGRATVLLLCCRNLQGITRQSRRSLHSQLSSALLQHLVKNYYVQAHATKQCCGEDDFRLNTLGSILIKNWEAEWWKSARRSDLTPVEGNFHLKMQDEDHQQRDILKLVEQKMTDKGIALTADLTGPDLKIKRVLVVAKKISNGEDGAEDYQIQFEQLKFLKNFLNKPSRIKVVNGKSDEIAMEHHRVLYENDSESYCIQDMRKCAKTGHGSPDVTVFTLDTQQLFLATMMDAYGERNNHIYLKIHPKLAPIKVFVFGESTENSKLVEEMCTMLRSWNVPCWNGVEKGLTATDADELGTPFTVTLPDNVNESGLLHVRSLNTNAEMDVHISQIGSTLLQYLRFTY